MSDSGPRSKKRTLQSLFLPRVAHLTTDGIVEPDAYRQVLRSLHTSAVAGAISAAPNRILGAPPPDIDSSEAELTRSCRTTLSQLRSGHCSRLAGYLHRIGALPSPTCPDCLSTDQTVEHVFMCPSSPTDLTTEDLWVNPAGVIQFLAGTSSFSNLVLSDPPLPTGPGPPPPLP